MAVEIRRGSSRFLDRSARGEPGRATAHSFSFGEHYDPDRTSFGPMVCHDDHRLAEGSGFDPHRHAGLVIVTWVLAGALAHTDSATGDTVVVQPGAVAVLHAGAGVEHREVAAAPQTRFVQVWLTADGTDAAGPPAYAVTPADPGPGSLTEVAAPLPGAAFSVARLAAGDTVTLPTAARVHAFVARGALVRSSLAEPLADGDAFLLTDEAAGDVRHRVTAAVPTELLVWAFDRGATAGDDGHDRDW